MDVHNQSNRDGELVFGCSPSPGTGPPLPIDEVAMASIVSRLREREIKTLVMQEAQIDSACLFTLAGALADNTSVLFLDLCGTDLSESGEAMAQLIQTNSSIESLQLVGCSINSSVMRTLATSLISNESIWALAIGHNNLDEEGYELLGSVISEGMIGELSLAFDNDDAEEGPHKAANMYLDLELSKSLMVLNIQGLRESERMWRVFSMAVVICEGLDTLRLRDCNLNDSAVATIAMFMTTGRAEKLDLSRNEIGEDGALCIAVALAASRSIKDLVLSQNPLGQAVDLANALYTNKSLRVLDLDDTALGAKSLQAFRHALDHNHAIKTLSVEDNANSPEEHAIVADIKGTLHARRALHVRRVVRGAMRAAWLLIGIHLDGVKPGGKAFERAKESFNKAAAESAKKRQRPE